MDAATRRLVLVAPDV